MSADPDPSAPPPQPRLAAIAVVLDQGRVLLVRRAHKPDRGLWGFPGGKVEWGEPVFAAAQRELFEETGLQAEPLAHLTNLEVILHDEAGRLAHHYLLVAVLCRRTGGQVLAGDDADEAAWHPVEDVLAHRLKMSANVDTVLRQALKCEAEPCG